MWIDLHEQSVIAERIAYLFSTYKAGNKPEILKLIVDIMKNCVHSHPIASELNWQINGSLPGQLKETHSWDILVDLRGSVVSAFHIELIPAALSMRTHEKIQFSAYHAADCRAAHQGDFHAFLGKIVLADVGEGNDFLFHDIRKSKVRQMLKSIERIRSPILYDDAAIFINKYEGYYFHYRRSWSTYSSLGPVELLGPLCPFMATFDDFLSTIPRTYRSPANLPRRSTRDIIF